MSEKPENLEISFNKKVDCLLFAANLYKINITREKCAMMIKAYDAICVKGGHITIDELTEIEFTVGENLKERAVEKKTKGAKKNMKVGDKTPSWIEGNIVELNEKVSSKKALGE